jgi:uncharacterized membrane protein YesL
VWKTLWKTISRGLREYERYGYLYIQANLIMALLIIPVITAPAAYAGMVHMAVVAHRDTFTSLTEFWTGFRSNFRRSLWIGLLNVFFFVVLVTNVTRYAREAGFGFLVLRSAWVAITLVWLAIQLYVWPMLEVMNPPSLTGAYRNAALLIVKNPLYTAILLLLILAWLTISTVLIAPLVLFTFGLIANISIAAITEKVINHP